MIGHVLAIVLIALGNLFDYLSTKKGIESGLKEIGPVVKVLGLVETKLIESTAFIAIALANTPNVALWVGAVVFVVYSIVVVHNLREIRASH